MTKNIVRAVTEDVSAQMAIIENMARELQELQKEAERTNSESLRRMTSMMAAHLKQLSEKAYDVGERILDAA